MTRRAWFTGIAGSLFTAAFITLWKRHQEQREWERVLAYGQARARALGLDRMSEEEVEVYVDRMIHEYRAEQREKERAGKDTHIPPQ